MLLSHSRKLSFTVAVCLALLGISVLGQEATPTATSTPTSDSFDIPPEIAANEDEWPLGNHDYANTRAAINATIDSSNVSTLDIAWTVPLQGVGGWGAAAGNPLIADGVVYFQDLAANTYAVSLEDGSEIWKTMYHNQIFGPSGPGIGYGKVFVNTRIDRYSALDMETGQELWSTETGIRNPSGAMQPSVFDHTVYATTQAASAGHGKIVFDSYQPGSSGSVLALNPDTGETFWQWIVVEEGFWGHPEINSGGGLWFPPGIDPETGITYWGTGNPAPFPGLKDYPNGSSRPGPNLYTNSLVALSPTGEMLWYNQVLPHDLFNLDFQLSPILATVTIDGEERDTVIGGGKNGEIFSFDAATGETLWQTPVGTHQNDHLTELPLDETVWVMPGEWGGIETPMAYADGVIYAVTVNLPSPYHATAFDSETAEQALNRSEGGTLLDTGTAEVDAVDAATGEILWVTPLDRVAFGGVTVVNDLVFTATLDGIIYALRRETGEIVWQFKAPGGTNAWPAVAGDTIIWPIGIGSDPMVIALRPNGQADVPTPEQQRTPVHTPSGL